MIAFPPSFQRLVKELSRLPSIGEKSATRLAYHLVQNDKKLAQTLAAAIDQARTSVKLCESCFSSLRRLRVGMKSFCAVFAVIPGRERSILCVVERPMDVVAFERMGEFRGLYHVLHGLWAPLKGQGPESMKVAELIVRARQQGFKEIVIATGSTIEGMRQRFISRISWRTSEFPQVALLRGCPRGGSWSIQMRSPWLELSQDVVSFALILDGSGGSWGAPSYFK